MHSTLGRKALPVVATIALTLWLTADAVRAQCQGGPSGGRSGPSGGGPGMAGLRTAGGLPGGSMPGGGMRGMMSGLRTQGGGQGMMFGGRPPGGGQLNGFPPQQQQNGQIAALLQQQQLQQQQNAAMLALQQQQRQNQLFVNFQQPQNFQNVNRRPQQRLDVLENPPPVLPPPVQKDAVPQPNDPEEIAARMLKTARDLALDADDAKRNGERDRAQLMHDKAANRLKDVVFAFGDTRAAAQARDLLDKMGP